MKIMRKIKQEMIAFEKSLEKFQENPNLIHTTSYTERNQYMKVICGIFGRVCLKRDFYRRLIRQLSTFELLHYSQEECVSKMEEIFYMNFHPNAHHTDFLPKFERLRRITSQAFRLKEKALKLLYT